MDSSFKTIALSTLFFQYAFRESTGKRVTPASLRAEVNDWRLSLLKEDDDDDIADVAHATISDFLYRRSKKTKGKTLDVIERFLLTKNYLAAAWYKNLEVAEKGITEHLQSLGLSSTCPDIEGLYLFEGHAFTETLISYFLIGTTERNATVVQFGERVYRRHAGSGEVGNAFQMRLDNAEPDLSKSTVGYIRPSSSCLSLHLLGNFEEGIPPRVERIGTVSAIEEKNKSALGVKLNEDGNLREYVKYTQAIDNKDENVPNLTNRYIKNIITTSRFFNSRNVRSKMEPVFFEERELDFSDLDFRLLDAAAEGDAVEMIKCIVEGADINVCDPETGKTALHLATKALSIPAACVLVPREYAGYREDMHDAVLADLYRICESENVGRIEDIDFKLKSAQQKLNPLLLDKDHNFASTESRFEELMPAVLNREIDDPLYDTRYDLEMIVGNNVVGRLGECGIVPVIAGMPVESRLAHINAYRAHKAATQPDFSPGF